MSTSILKIHHLYYGNIDANGIGYKVLQSSPGAHDWADYCLSHAALGDLSRIGPDWHKSKEFRGVGAFDLGEDGVILCFLARVNAPLGEAYSPALYHWLLLTREDVLMIDGLLGAVWDQLSVTETEWEKIRQTRKGNLNVIESKEIEISIDRIRQKREQTKQVNKLRELFMSNRQGVIDLLSSLLDGEESVALFGLDTDTTKRIEFASALSIIFPKQLRFMLSFATRVVSSSSCKAHLKMMWDDQPSDLSGERRYNWKTAKYEMGDGKPLHPYLKIALHELEQGTLEAFHDRWEERVSRLFTGHTKGRMVLDTLVEWIETLRYPTASGLLTLLQKDPTVLQQERVVYFTSAFKLIIEQTTPISEDHIKQSANQLQFSGIYQQVVRPLLDSYFSSHFAKNALTILLGWHKIFPTYELIQLDVAKWITQYNRWVSSQLLVDEAGRWLEQGVNPLFKQYKLPLPEIVDEQIKLIQKTRKVAGQNHILLIFRLALYCYSASQLTKIFEVYSTWVSFLPDGLKSLNSQSLQGGSLIQELKRIFPDIEDQYIFKLLLYCASRNQIEYITHSYTIDWLLKRGSFHSGALGKVEEFSQIIHFDNQQLFKVSTALLDWEKLYDLPKSYSSEALTALIVWNIFHISEGNDTISSIHFKRALNLITLISTQENTVDKIEQVLQAIKNSFDRYSQIIPERSRFAANFYKILAAYFSNKDTIKLMTAIIYLKHFSPQSGADSHAIKIVTEYINPNENLDKYELMIVDNGVHRSLLQHWIDEKEIDLAKSILSLNLRYASSPNILPEDVLSRLREPRKILNNAGNKDLIKFYNEFVFNALSAFSDEKLDAIQGQLKGLSTSDEGAMIEQIKTLRMILPDGDFQWLSQRIQMTIELLDFLSKLDKNKTITHDQDAEIMEGRIRLALMSQQQATLKNFSPEQLKRMFDDMQSLLKRLESEKQLFGGGITGLTEQIFRGEKRPKTGLGLLIWMNGVVDRVIRTKRNEKPRR
jgi:hypothetical protein